MIKPIIQYLNLKLQALNIVPRLYELVEMGEMKTSDNSQTYLHPGEYIGNGELKPIDFDTQDGLIYHRKTGPTESEQVEGVIGGRTDIIERTPMKLVAYINRTRFNTDDVYFADKMAQNIRNVMSFTNDKDLRKALKLRYISTIINSYNTNTRLVIEEELPEEVFIDDAHVMISITYSLELKGAPECFLTYGCDDDEIDFITNLISNICPGVTIYDSDGETVITKIPAGGSYTIEETDTVLIRSYKTDDPAIQVAGQPLQREFSEFQGYDIDDMAVIAQGVPGVLGFLSTLSTNKKFITGWDSLQARMTFKTGVLANDNQITIIGKR